jgi:phosphatidylserine/phosphatidylglycerophosphate/cardiolipin synthase-like enzyme
VRLLVADWSTRPGSEGRRDLDALAAVANVEVRVLRIPTWSGGEIPFARVAHAKFMVVDRGTAWVGSSNWEGDYFYASRNVGAIAAGGQLPATLQRVLDANWTSPYAVPLADVTDVARRPTAGRR